MPPDPDSNNTTQSGADGAVDANASGARIVQFDLTIEQVSHCLPDYEVSRIVGSGAMGVVFEANHKPLQRRVALKILPPGLASREATIQRFLREAEIVAKIHHEHIVPIYDVGSRAGLHYIAMRFVPGVSLDRAVSAAPLSPKEVAEIGVSISRALAFAHKHGIVHRDVKPANIMREPDGRVSLTDFGLARVDGTGTMTESGALVGTPNYMSPEQIQGSRDAVDGRSDLYSLGVSLYELLTGRPPFQETTTAGTLRAILDKPSPRIRKFRPDCPPALAVILDKSMRKDRGARYANASAFAEDLERFLNGQPIHAKRESLFIRSWRIVNASRGAFIAGTVAVLLAIGLTYVLYSNLANKYEDAVAEARALMNEVTPETPDRIATIKTKLALAHDHSATRVRACRLGIQFALKAGDNFPELYDLAINDCATLLAEKSLNIQDEVYALYFRGKFALKTGKVDVAQESLRRVAAVAPNHRRTSILSAILAKEAGRSFEQQGDSTEALLQWDMARELLIQKALFDEDTTKPREAFDDEMAEVLAEAHIELGTVYKYMGNIIDAKKEYDRAAVLSPRNAELHVLMADLNRGEGKESEASIEEALAKAFNPFVNVTKNNPIVGTEFTNSIKNLGDTFRGILRSPSTKPATQPAVERPKPI